MLKWFKKEGGSRSDALPPHLESFLKPMALATAIAEIVGAYAKSVQRGEVSSPAYRRKDASAVEVWRDTRLEALRHLWGYGASDAMLLADPRQQEALLGAFFKNKPHLEFPHQPSGDPVRDTLQALFQVYEFLGKAGSAVADSATDRLSLSQRRKTIFSEFEDQAKSLLELWAVFMQAIRGSGELPATPPTLFEVLFRDVTSKAKTIALSARFGPDYRAGMAYIVTAIQKQLKDRGESPSNIEKKMHEVQSLMQAVLAADDPDHLG